MKTSRLVFRNLKFFWRTNLAILLGVAVAVAVFSGALLVGQSVRDSLRSLLYQRIGASEYIVTANNFFGERLANQLSPEFRSCPIIILKGVLIHEATQVRAHNVNVYGVDERFWKFNGLANPDPLEGNTSLVGEALAKQLHVRPEDTLLLRIETQQAIPKEWLYGRRDTSGKTIRLKCGKILGRDILGEFALRPNQGNVFSIFVPLRRLQHDLAQASRVNAILLSGKTMRAAGSEKALQSVTETQAIQTDLKNKCTLLDLGVHLRDLPDGHGFSLESNRIVLDDHLAQAAIAAASASEMHYAPVYTYLANALRANGREIPYSVMTAADPGALTFDTNPTAGTAMRAESIWLTDWALRNLGVSAGALIDVDYYLWLESGQLVTRTARFRLAGTIPSSKNINASFAPEIPGITEADSISSWDPPFPLDLGRIRREDEDFWNRYKATPKAFIPLLQGQKLWSNRFGRLTAIRLAPPQGTDMASARARFSSALLERLDPQQNGLLITDIRQQGIHASAGSTDFGEYFVYFSSFLIAAAIILSALFFKLMIEQRVREIGILRATGFRIDTLRRIFLAEGIALSVAGSLLGLLGALAYGWFMIFGLRTWWVGAVGTERLSLHLSWTNLLTGVLSGIVLSLAAIYWTLRQLRKYSPRMLLAGVIEASGGPLRRARSLVAAAALSTLLSVLLLAVSSFGEISPLEGFFGSGFLLLISFLCWTSLYLHRKNRSLIHGSGWVAFARFGLRNATHRPGRSLVCAALIASATFIIISMEAFRLDPQSISFDPHAGTGGFPLVAESAIPIVHDPNTEEGREAIGLSGLQTDIPVSFKFVSFRERPGDDVSCLNLYAPQEVRVLGAPRTFTASGRFSFQSSLSRNDLEKKNPWLLLEKPTDGSAIPAIADANTIQYIFHQSLGSEITVRGDSGKPVRLKLVAALSNSILQGEVLISESDFLRIFPEHQGYSFFLLDLPPDRAPRLGKPLQDALADWGLIVESTQERLAAYRRVENTYLSTFQSLGALGLVLGTAGLAAILLRNVLERRKELALLRAAGYSNRVLSGIIVFENAALLIWSLAAGTACALLAVIPALQSRGASFPFAISGLLILLVLAAGLLSSLLAVFVTLRSPLIAALHSE